MTSTFASGQIDLWIVFRQYGANGELILAGGSGTGYRFAELGSANNPSGWAGVLKVKTPAGATLGYILLYSNP